jgi:hypothetical protein
MDTDLGAETDDVRVVGLGGAGATPPSVHHFSQGGRPNDACPDVLGQTINSLLGKCIAATSTIDRTLIQKNLVRPFLRILFTQLYPFFICCFFTVFLMFVLLAYICCVLHCLHRRIRKQS